eukprot:SAG31_NODE_1432_length_8373_cov_8.838289_14_plen_135_part_00
MCEHLICGLQGRLGTCLEEFREFISPFNTPAFWWLWVQGFVGTTGGIIQGYFMFYWFQDCFTEGYWVVLPGLTAWRVAINVQCVLIGYQACSPLFSFSALKAVSGSIDKVCGLYKWASLRQYLVKPHYISISEL